MKDGLCRFQIKLGNDAEPRKKHLIYSGEFVGEKAFILFGLFGERTQAKRSGSVYAETKVNFSILYGGFKKDCSIFIKLMNVKAKQPVKRRV